MNKTIKHTMITTMAASTIMGVITPSITYAAAIPADTEIIEYKAAEILSEIENATNAFINDGKVFVNTFKEYDNMTYSKFHFLPTKFKPNSTVELISPYTGKLMQTRVYDSSGNAKLDIDYTCHGDPVFTKDVHKHIWKNGKRSAPQELTRTEFVKYFMVPNGRVNQGEKLTPLYEEDQPFGIKISYDEFVNALKQNRDIQFRIGTTDFNICYGKGKKGDAMYKLIYKSDFLGSSVLEYNEFYSKKDILEYRLHGHTFQEIWDSISISSIN